LKVIKSLALDWGASWEFDDAQAVAKYKPMLSEDGIVLDYSPS
jgi:hypothetical protein